MSPACTPARLTVLGATGFVGGALVRHARAAGLDVQAPPRGAELDAGPMGHVVYAIGLTADFRRRPLDTVEAHVGLLVRLLAHGRFDSLTYLSSTRPYADATSGDERAVLRVDPHDPGDLYDLSKLTGESLCLHGGRPARAVRLSNVVGPRADADSFVEQMAGEAERTGVVRLAGDPRAHRDYVALDDAVALITRIAIDPGASGLYNVAGGEPVSNARVAHAVGEALGLPVAMPDVAHRPAPPPSPAVDIGRVRREFGFEPQPFDRHFPAYLRARRAPKADHVLP